MKNQNKQNNLQKKLYGDTFLCGVITVGAAIVGIARLCSFFSLNARLGKDGTLEDYAVLKDHLDVGVTGTLLAAALVFLFLTLLEIHKTGRPFSKSICRDLRTMGWLILAAGLSRTVTDVISGFITPFNSDIYFVLADARTLLLAVFAAVVLIFAEVVNYGCSIQEDLDSIA